MNHSKIPTPPSVSTRWTPSAAIGVGTFKISEKAIRYVNDVLRSERLSYGPYIQKFEKVFAAAHDCRFAIMTNSGTSSLMIALHALKLKHGWADGDEVIVPSVTFVATMNIVLQLNLKPVIVDVDPIYYEMDPKLFEAAITPRTRCVLPVHLFGHPADMDAIGNIAAAHKLRILEDSCETMFTRLNGRSVGAMGDIGCFSTYVAHLLCTGVGGLCTTNDPELAILMRSLANHGRDSIYLNIDDDNGKTAEEMRLIIQKRFSFISTGYSFRATELEGAIGLAEFENREPMMQARRDNGAFFNKHLKSLESYLQLPTIRSGAGHAFMMYPIVLKDRPKIEMVEFLEARGIETRDMLPLVNQPVYQSMGVRENDFPVAKWINHNGFYIGCHQGISELERDYMVETLHRYFDKASTMEQRACLIVMSNVDSKLDPLVLENIVQSFGSSAFQEKILLDAGCQTQVAEAFRSAGFLVLSEKRGKGDFLRKALETTTCKHIITIGIDGSDNPADLTPILLKLRQGNDLVVGSRFSSGGERQSVRPLSYRSLGNRFFSFLASILFRGNVTDGNNLLRGFSRNSIQRLGLRNQGNSIMFEMTAAALANRLTYSECPVTERAPLLKVRRSNRLISAFSLLWILIRFTLPTQKTVPSQEAI